MGALLMRQSGSNFDGRNNKRRNNKDMVDELLGEFEPSIRSARVEGVFRAVDRGVYYDKQEGDQTDPYGKSPWNPPYSNLHLSSSQIYATVVEALELQPGMSFLNLGSGSGYLSTLIGLLIGPTGLNHGIELHKDVVEYAYKRLEQFKQTSCAIDKYDFAEPIFINGNFLNFNPSHLYDRVYLGAECLPDALRFVMQLVKPAGGILIMPYEENLMRYVRLSESKWHSESLINVIFTTMIGLGPLVGHDGELREQRMFEIPAKLTKSLKELCRIVIRQQVRLQTERANPELANSDNLDQRRELRERKKQLRLAIRRNQLGQLQNDCRRCRRESWRSTAGLKEGEHLLGQEERCDKVGRPTSFTPKSVRRRLWLKMNTMGIHGGRLLAGSNNKSTQHHNYFNQSRAVASNRDDNHRVRSDRTSYDYGDDDEDNWANALRSYPRHLLFNRPLGGATSARPFRHITFEDILSGHPPLSELMRYRPASPRRTSVSQRTMRPVVDSLAEEMMDFELQPRVSSPPPPPSPLAAASSHGDSSSTSLLSSGIDENNLSLRSESSSSSNWDSNSDSDHRVENIIVVDSDDDDDDDERDHDDQQHESRLRSMWSDFFRGLEPTDSHWLASTEEEDGDDDDDEEEEDEDESEQPSRRNCQQGGQLPSGCCHSKGASSLLLVNVVCGENRDLPGSPLEASISCRPRSMARNGHSLLVSNDISGGQQQQQRQRQRRKEQAPGREFINLTTATTHDSFTSGGPLTRSAAARRAVAAQPQPVQAVLGPASSSTGPDGRSSNSVSTSSCSPQTTLTSMSDDAHQRRRRPQRCWRPSHGRKRKRQSSSSSSSSSELDDKSSVSFSSSGHQVAGRSGRAPRSSDQDHSSAPGKTVHTGGAGGERIPGATSVAIDSQGVMSTMARPVMMRPTCARPREWQDGDGGGGRTPSSLTRSSRRQALGLGSCGLAPFVASVVGTHNNDNNEQVAQHRTPDARSGWLSLPTSSQVCRLQQSASRRLLVESDQPSQTGNVNHSHRDCKQLHRNHASSAHSCHLRGLRRRRRRLLELSARSQVLAHDSGRRAASASAANSSCSTTTIGAGRRRRRCSSQSATKLSECEKYRSYMSASIRKLPVPNVLRNYLNHERAPS